MYKHNKIKIGALLVIIGLIITIVLQCINLGSFIYFFNIEDYEKQIVESVELYKGDINETLNMLGITLMDFLYLIKNITLGVFAFNFIYLIITAFFAFKILPLEKMDDADLVNNTRKIKRFKRLSIISLFCYMKLMPFIMVIAGIVLVSKELKETERALKYAHLYSDNKPEYKEPSINENNNNNNLENEEDYLNENYYETQSQADKEIIYEKLATLEKQYKNHEIDEAYYREQKEYLINQIK